MVIRSVVAKGRGRALPPLAKILPPQAKFSREGPKSSPGLAGPKTKSSGCVHAFPWAPHPWSTPATNRVTMIRTKVELFEVSTGNSRPTIRKCKVVVQVASAQTWPQPCDVQEALRARKMRPGVVKGRKNEATLLTNEPAFLEARKNSDLLLDTLHEINYQADLLTISKQPKLLTLAFNVEKENIFSGNKALYEKRGGDSKRAQLPLPF